METIHWESTSGTEVHYDEWLNLGDIWGTKNEIFDALEINYLIHNALKHLYPPVHNFVPFCLCVKFRLKIIFLRMLEATVSHLSCGGKVGLQFSFKTSVKSMFFFLWNSLYLLFISDIVKTYGALPEIL